MKKLMFLFVALAAAGSIMAQNGSNEPCNAPYLTAYPSCAAVTEFVATSRNTPEFTNSTIASSGVLLPTLTCNGFDNTTRDFWYRCVVPASGKVTVVMDYGSVSGGDTGSNRFDIAAYSSSSNTCAGSTFTEIGKECSNGYIPYMPLTGLTPGKTIYIRIWVSAASQFFNYNFLIWAIDGNVAAPVACPTLVSPTMSVSLTSDPLLIWTTDPLTIKYDVYFGQKSSISNMKHFDNNAARTTVASDSFTLPHTYTYNTPYTVFVEPDALNFWFVYQKNCATDRNPACTPASYIAASVPTNDDCGGAIVLNTTNVYKKYSSASSSESRGPSLCSGTTAPTASDVWFKFTTNATGGSVTVKVKTANVEMDAVVQAFSGTCAALTAVKCVDAVGVGAEEFLILSNLIANTTYYVRVYAVYSGYYLYGEEFDIAITGNIVIPVELTTFTGKTQGTANALNWQTASERNAQSFAVERSVDGENGFAEIGTIKAVGLSSTPQYYAFLDENPTSVSYYRLRQTDFDGKSEFSKTISVQRKDKRLTLDKAFPSPVTNELTVQYSAERNGFVSLKVVDVFGRLILAQNDAATEGGNVSKLNLTNLATGAYILLLSDGQKAAQMRIVKQ